MGGLPDRADGRWRQGNPDAGRWSCQCARRRHGAAGGVPGARHCDRCGEWCVRFVGAGCTRAGRGLFADWQRNEGDRRDKARRHHRRLGGCDRPCHCRHHQDHRRHSGVREGCPAARAAGGVLRPGRVDSAGGRRRGGDGGAVPRAADGVRLLAVELGRADPGVFC